MSETIEPMPTNGDRRDLQALADELVHRAKSERVDLVGLGGLLTGLTKTVLETALVPPGKAIGAENWGDVARPADEEICSEVGRIR